MSEVGTLAWARRTGGRMTPREQLAFAVDGVASQLRLVPPRIAAALGLRRERLARLDLDAVALPDTPAAREAEEACDSLSPAVAQHSRRTYLWAAALAGLDGVEHDAELLYCAALLHDTGLPRRLDGAGDGPCFTVDSALDGEEIGHRAGWDGARRERIATALTLHFNASVPLERGAEAHLLSAGAALDVIGQRAWDVVPETRRAVLERHPRLGFKREIDALLRAHAAAAPHGRVAFLYRFGVLGLLIRTAPFDD